ncbi:hypothetical protein QE392_001069 [Microbacterium proteolyticum]|nr:hypothetical protein [Microbacterium sp. SORGH_AS_0344]MDQ1169265.1 hypothetical protein [Microbacterium proteolyticum]
MEAGPPVMVRELHQRGMFALIVRELLAAGAS